MPGIQTIDGRSTDVSDAALSRLRSSVAGAVLTASDPPYAEARHIWNGTVDRHPSVIVRCTSVSDVQAALRFAVENDLQFSVCGGGHNVAGWAVADGGLMIDLRELSGIDVDPDNRIVRVGGGAVLGDVDAATLPHGLAVPVGVVGETGVGGLTLGGGIGWLRRKHGLTSDNLLAATVVTASGDVVRASSDQHPDLLWALRGGGGNFGIVTQFEFQAHPISDQVYFALVFHPIENAKEGLRRYRELAENAPDDMNAFAILWSVPESDEFPAEHHGAPALVFAVAWLGDPAEGERYLSPLRSFARPIADLSGMTPFADVQKLFDEDYPSGGRYYWKSNYISALDDDAIEDLIELALARPSRESSIDIWQLGGAIQRATPESSAYPHRGAPYLLGIEANWNDPADDEANRDWARNVYDRTAKYGYGGAVYVNFPGHGEEGDSLVRGAYGVNYARLQAVKARYDPQNRFRMNQNIRPAD